MPYTLGEGNRAEVLHVPPHGPAVTITSCPATLAATVASALNASAARIEAELYPVAVEADGVPVDVRRRLLAVFDTGTANGDPAWAGANDLALRLRAAVADAPDPVQAAVRREFAGHLTGLDGVLVPGVITGTGYRPSCIRLVITSALAVYADRLDTLLPGLSTTAPDFRPYADGDEALVDFGSETCDLVSLLWGAEPRAGAGFEEAPVAQVQDEAAANQQSSDLHARVGHVLAWLAAVAPDRVDEARAALTRTP